MGKTRDYNDWLLGDLKDHEHAAAYISAHVDDFREFNEAELFLSAVLSVAKVHSGDDLAKVFDLVLKRYR